MILQIPIQNPVITGLYGKYSHDSPVLFGNLVSSLVSLILVVASLFTFAQLIIGGLNWISSGGDKSKLEAAQQKITQAIVGLFIVAISWAIYLLLLTFLGMNSGDGLILKFPSLLD